MSAETLRRAAALMRERAEAAHAGPWEARIGGIAWVALYADENTIPEDESLPSMEPGGTATPADAEHIASWHPAVALAVADWLDAEAERWRKEQDRSWGCVLIRTDFEPPTETSARNALQAECDATADRLCGPALTVARAYLGESA